MIDWTHVLIAAIGGVPATIAAAGSVWLGRLNAQKIDRNTALTKAGTAAAAVAAQKANTIAEKTETLTSTVAEKLNGSLDERIHSIVREHLDPLKAVFDAHVEQEGKNMREIRTALGELRDRIPK